MKPTKTMKRMMALAKDADPGNGKTPTMEAGYNAKVAKGMPVLSTSDDNGGYPKPKVGLCRPMKGRR